MKTLLARPHKHLRTSRTLPSLLLLAATAFAQTSPPAHRTDDGRAAHAAAERDLFDAPSSFVPPRSKGRPWAPEQATGAPDTPRLGDFPTAWASAFPDQGPEWLQVKFDLEVDVEAVIVRESFNPGAITKISALAGPDRREVTLIDATTAERLLVGTATTLEQSADPAATAPGVAKRAKSEPSVVRRTGGAGDSFKTAISEVRAPEGVRSAEVKIYLDTAKVPGWNEIDAVELVGRDGTRQWASKANASSSYAERAPSLTGELVLSGLGDYRVTADAVSGAVPGGELIESIAARLAQVEAQLSTTSGARSRRKSLKHAVETTSFLGTELSPGDASRAGEQGVTIVRVFPDSAAQAAGLQNGDRILRIDGETMREPDDVVNFIGKLKPGRLVVITYVRGDAQEATTTAKLRERPTANKPVRLDAAASVTEPQTMKSPRSWGPEQACGAPNVPVLSDSSRAWAPATADGGEECLHVFFDRATALTKVNIHQSYGPGAIIKVMAVGSTEAESMIWDAAAVGAASRDQPASGSSPVILSLDAPRVGLVAKSVKVFLDTSRVPGWNEIDAVELIGSDGSRQWASRASASSFYGSPGESIRLESTIETFKRATNRDEVVKQVYELDRRLAELEARIARTTAIPHEVAKSSAAPPRPFTPEQACGAPDTPKMGDHPTAWAPAAMDAGEEWLEVVFERPVEPVHVVIHESYNPGAVVRVVAILDPGTTSAGDVPPEVRPVARPSGDHKEVVLWSGKAEAAQPGGDAPRVFTVSCASDTPVSRLRIHLDTSKVPGWNEIDAVALVGRDGSQQWAKHATASSSYGDHLPRTTQPPAPAR